MTTGSMNWKKNKATSQGDCIHGGKLANSAVWQAKSAGLIFTACSNRKARHGGWVLRWKAAGTGFPETLTFKNFGAAKAHADRVVAQT